MPSRNASWPSWSLLSPKKPSTLLSTKRPSAPLSTKGAETPSSTGTETHLLTPAAYKLPETPASTSVFTVASLGTVAISPVPSANAVS
ncbi:MAG: hypothetical protein LQ341_006448, partial [Variospora aurantia]